MRSCIPAGMLLAGAGFGFRYPPAAIWRAKRVSAASNSTSTVYLGRPPQKQTCAPQFGSEAGKAIARPLEGLRVPGNPLRQEFESHEAMQLGVLGLVNHPYAPAAELLKDAIVRHCLANHDVGTRP